MTRALVVRLGLRLGLRPTCLLGILRPASALVPLLSALELDREDLARRGVRSLPAHTAVWIFSGCPMAPLPLQSMTRLSVSGLERSWSLQSSQSIFRSSLRKSGLFLLQCPLPSFSRLHPGEGRTSCL